jgi:hypothetical protein
MEARLSVLTCDKCGEPMKRDEEVIVIADGWIRGPKHDDLITFWGSCIRYACHRACWNGVEEDVGISS